MSEPADTNPQSNMQAAIGDLVERFERNIDSYRKGAYNETLVRRVYDSGML